MGSFLIGLATVIVLLHSITPHQHHKTSQISDHTISEVRNDSNVINWLQFIFHPDLGEEHLENFQNEHPLELAIPDLAFLAVAIVFVPQTEVKLEHNTPYIFSIKDSDFLSPRQLRGPPSLV